MDPAVPGGGGLGLRKALSIASRLSAAVTLSTIIFDFGGVVIQWDPRRVYRRFFETDDAIDHFFEEVGFSAWNLEQDRGRSWADAVAELSARFPHHHELIRAYDEFWEESIVGPIEGTVQIIQRLRAAGRYLVGLTNWSAEKFRLTRGRYEVFRLFDDIVVSGEHGLAKPDREIFQLTLRRIGRSAEECLFIDDWLPNIDAAEAMGFATIHFQSAAQLEDELRAKALL